MSRLTQLVFSQHGQKRLDKSARLSFFAKQHVVPIQAEEIGQTATCYPVFFNRHDDTGAWTISALGSFIAGDHLYIANNRWNAVYEPVFMKTYPFFLMERGVKNNTDNRKRRTVLGFDDSAQLLSETRGDSLFDVSGKPTSMQNEIKKMLKTNVQAVHHTRWLAQELHDLNLLNSVNLQVAFDGDMHQTITGLYTINEDCLNSMNNTQLGALKEKGYLAPIYAMLLSIYQLNTLIQLHNIRSNEEPKEGQEKNPLSVPIKTVNVELARDGSRI